MGTTQTPKRHLLGGLRLLALQISKSTMRRETTGVITVFVALLLVCGLSTELEMHEGETFTSSSLASHYTSCSNAIANVRVTLEGDGAKSGKLVHDQLEDIARACLAGTTIQLGEASQAEHGAGPVLNYQVQLRTEQRKCPNSDLVCPPISAGPTRKPVARRKKRAARRKKKKIARRKKKAARRKKKIARRKKKKIARRKKKAARRKKRAARRKKKIARRKKKKASNKPMVLQHPKDFENCVSEGGPWNCARCREADGTGGALPCDWPHPYPNVRTYSQCPDDLSGAAVGFYVGWTRKQCVGFGADLKHGGRTGFVRTEGFPYATPKYSGTFKASTKYSVGHPQWAHPTEGFIMFKRAVFHKSGNTTKADVYKVGYCIRCPLIPFKKFGRHHAYQTKFGVNCNWGCYLKNNPDLRRHPVFRHHVHAAFHYRKYGIKEGRDCTCGLSDLSKRAIRFGMLSKDRRKRAVFKQNNHATNDEKKVFVKECVKNAFGRNRRLKKSYECSSPSNPLPHVRRRVSAADKRDNMYRRRKLERRRKTHAPFEWTSSGNGQSGFKGILAML